MIWQQLSHHHMMLLTALLKKKYYEKSPYNIIRLELGYHFPKTVKEQQIHQGSP